MKNLMTPAPGDSLVTVEQQTVYTTSLLVAEKFGKRHDTVLRKIDTLRLSQPEFGRRNFAESSYMNSQRKKQKSYLLTQEGFSMIAMRFTGKAAEEWQINFITAFQKMRLALERVTVQKTDPEWHKSRDGASLEFRLMCETLEEQRRETGKTTKTHHYSNEARLCNWALTGKFGPIDRDTLTAAQIKLLGKIQRKNVLLIAQGFEYDERKRLLRKAFPLLSLVGGGDA